MPQDRCRTCSGPIQQPPTGRRRTYCSDKCKVAAQLIRRGKLRSIAPEGPAKLAGRDDLLLTLSQIGQGELRAGPGQVAAITKLLEELRREAEDSPTDEVAILDELAQRRP